jgi:hypothetical protein
MKRAGLTRIKIAIMKIGLVIIYQLLLMFSSFIISTYVISPLAMVLTCLTLKFHSLQSTELLRTWLISGVVTAVPVYIIEEIRYLKRRKEETLQLMKDKSEKI